MVSDFRRELLVLVHAAQFPAAVQRIRGLARVTQLLPPRLVLVDDTRDVREDAAAVEGVIGVFDDLSVLEHDLDETSRAFVRAWDARKERKDRPDDGRKWDDPGFEPPDGARRP